MVLETKLKINCKELFGVSFLKTLSQIKAESPVKAIH